MKTAVSNQETIRLDKIEKTTMQILKKINSIRPNFFSSSLKFSKKAEEEKELLFKELIPEKIFSIDKTLELLSQISDHANFSKLDQKDQDFIVRLKNMDLKNSHYLSEIINFFTQGHGIDVIFFLAEDNVFFNYLNSQLFDITYKLNLIPVQP
ncbi:hypothetical protein IRZ83_01090 [Flavobacterium sp. JLP]|uniref:hypothetical protein n=1 Tax=unclassified Flavobacterium TaxID=196869 RepID=UPI000492F00F|nr:MULTISPECIES: hypothetical protein [unclassified Flavobacterium]MBF4491130.1 hypothetical protein [Flavobacterium sp. MR2016-29]MBF4505242.1 hypothetical protein [Flavobacterium sp. JLP]